jgi:hypothetical protein
MLRTRLVLLVGLGGALGCNSDDTGAAPTSTSTGDPGSSTTSAPTSTGDTSTGTSTGTSTTTVDPTTGDPTTGAPDQTCSDALMCFTGCAVSLDLACFQACTDNLPPEEGMKALALGACVVQGCFTSEACTVDTLQDPLCLACIGIGLLSKSDPNCKEQADACT